MCYKLSLTVSLFQAIRYWGRVKNWKRVREKNKGRGAGEGAEGEPVKTFFNGPVLVYQLLVYLPIGQF